MLLFVIFYRIGILGDLMGESDLGQYESFDSILVVEDEPTLAKEHALRLKRDSFEPTVFHSGEEALAFLETHEKHPLAVVLDLMMPGIGGLETLKRIRSIDSDLPVIVVSAQKKVSTAIETLRQGAYEYLIKPVPPEQLTATVRHAVQQRKVSMELSRLRREVKSAYTFDRLIGRSDAMLRSFKLVERTLRNDITVLVLGDSGTGKELIARSIHYNGIRADKPLVVVNCAAIPRELVESELFGHEKGSFTGALEKKIGKFEHANGGTLFLDEIGELELGVQAKLLRALQEGEIERVGGLKTIPVDVRLVCATQRKLDKEVREKRFREDLYYRINAFPVELPSLSERPGDVELLVGHFLDKHAIHLGREDIRGFTKEAVQALSGFDWPGNVRQLENVITRAMVLCENDVISLEDIPLEISDSFAGSDNSETSLSIFDSNESIETYQAIKASFSEDSDLWPNFVSSESIPSLEKIKEWAVRNAYMTCKENVSLTAKKLGLGRATLYRMLEKYDITSDSGETV
jgi:two-component system, NtrC family, response regulator AtoC